MKIGICIVPFGTTYLECREAALAVEASGFESVWTWDHLLSFNDDDEPVLECWTLLAGPGRGYSARQAGKLRCQRIESGPGRAGENRRHRAAGLRGSNRTGHRRRGETQGAGRVQQALPGREGAGGTGGGGRGTDEAHVDGRANQLPGQILQRRGQSYRLPPPSPCPR